MAQPKVFFVHLRRPSKNPNEQRDDPFYEFGSFGCTRCHCTNLFHPRHAGELEGARLAFIQGGHLGSRLVFLTSAVRIRVWKDTACEARWTPPEMPFKYTTAPIIAYNSGHSDFPLIEQCARKTNRTTIEGGLSSLFRGRAKPLPPELAKEVIAVYEGKRAEAPHSAIASSYEEALPYAPPRTDRNRKVTYRMHISSLEGDTHSGENVFQGELPPNMQSECRCSRSRRRRSDCRIG